MRTLLLIATFTLVSVVAWAQPTVPPLPAPGIVTGSRIVDTGQEWLIWGGHEAPPGFPSGRPPADVRPLREVAGEALRAVERVIPWDERLAGTWWSGTYAPVIGGTRRAYDATAERRRRLDGTRPVPRTFLLYDGPSVEGDTPDTVDDPLADVSIPTHLYVSHTFHVDDPSAWVALQTEIQFATGMVAWLNGHPIARHHLDVGLEQVRALATHYWLPDHIMQMVYRRWQRNWRGIDPGVLRAGANTLEAVVVRRDLGRERDLYFDLWIDAFDTWGFLRTPYLQRVESDRVTVMFVTNAPGHAWVEYGRSADGMDRLATHAMEQGTHHEVVLADLEADTRWYYRVAWRPVRGDGRLGPVQRSETASFRTAVEPGTPFTFLAYGDNRTHADVHTRLNRRMWDEAHRSDARFVVHTGDLITNASPWDEWQREFFVPALPLMGWFPFYTSLGNHEGNHTAYYENMDLPGNESWYSFRYGDAEFFALNTGIRMEADDAQIRWLADALETSPAPWKIVFFHHPPHACTPSRKPGDEAVRAHIVPLLEQHGVQLVLAGHDHLYGRSVELGGVTYVITGGGGAPTYPAAPDAINPICVRAHHFTRIRIDDARLHLEAIGLDGERIDAFELTLDPSRTVVPR